MPSNTCLHLFIQDSHLIRAQVDRTSASAWLYRLVVQHIVPSDNMSKNKPNTSMTHVAYDLKLRSVVRSSMHPCQHNWFAVGRAVVFYVQAAHAFSAGITRWHVSTYIALIYLHVASLAVYTKTYNILKYECTCRLSDKYVKMEGLSF